VEHYWTHRLKNLAISISRLSFSNLVINTVVVVVVVVAVEIISGIISIVYCTKVMSHVCVVSDTVVVKEP